MRFRALLVVLSIFSFSCGGTESGNPAVDAPPGTLASNEAILFGRQAASIICSRITACFTSTTFDGCYAGLFATSNLGPAFGASVVYSSWSVVVEAEKNSTLVPKSQAASQCLSELSALTCSSSAVQSAYSASDPANFGNVVNLVPTSSTSCKGVY